MAEYTIKNLKTFRGHGDEGHSRGFTCTLYRGKTKVAEIFNDSWGGPLQIDYKDEQEKALFLAHIATLPPCADYVTEADPEPIPINEDIFIEDLVSEAEEIHWLKRQCKTKIVAREKDAPKGEFVQFKAQYTPERAEQVRKKYPQIVEIVNERFLK